MIESKNIGKTDKKKRPLSVHSFRYGFHGFNLPRVIRAHKTLKAIFAHHPQKTAFTIEAIMMVHLNTHVAASIFYRVKNIKKRANYIQIILHDVCS